MRAEVRTIRALTVALADDPAAKRCTDAGVVEAAAIAIITDTSITIAGR